MNLDKGGGSSRGPRSPGGAHAGKGCGKFLMECFAVVVALVALAVWFLS